MDNRLFMVEKKLDKLIPEIRNVSKHLAEAKRLANKGKPPRRQPKKNKAGVTILDNNPLSIASFMEDHPEVDLQPKAKAKVQEVIENEI